VAIKEKNNKILAGFGILLYIWFALVNGFNWTYLSEIDIRGENIFSIKPILALFFYIASLVMTNVIPPEWKHIIIYLRVKNPLPGSRVFTQLAKNDNRISYKDIETQYGPLPTNPKSQNMLWYEIYKKKQTDVVVRESHGRWLLFRDMFAITMITLIPSATFTLWYSGIIKGVLYTILYFVLTIILWVCSRNAGNRFVCNVLAR